MNVSRGHIMNLVKNVEPSMAFSEKEDFFLWQEKAKEKLCELLGLPLENCDDSFEITADSEEEGYRKIDFTYQAEEGFFVPATLLVPKAAKGPLPVAICLQGHSTGMHISLGVAKFEGDEGVIAGGRDFAVRAVEEGFCAIALEQKYMGSLGSNESGAPSCGSENAAMPGLLIGRTAIGERVWCIKRLIDVIENHLTDFTDAEKIILMGNSGGGTATFYASCIDERIALSMPSCAVCTFEDSIMAMHHCPCNYVPNIRKYFNMGDLGCLIAPRKLVMVCGKNDPIFPIEGAVKSFETIKKAYAAAGKEALCHLVIGDGGHQFYPDDAWPIVHKIF